MKTSSEQAEEIWQLYEKGWATAHEAVKAVGEILANRDKEVIAEFLRINTERPRELDV